MNNNFNSIFIIVKVFISRIESRVTPAVPAPTTGGAKGSETLGVHEFRACFVIPNKTCNIFIVAFVKYVVAD